MPGICTVPEASSPLLTTERSAVRAFAGEFSQRDQVNAFPRRQAYCRAVVPPSMVSTVPLQ